MSTSDKSRKPSRTSSVSARKRAPIDAPISAVMRQRAAAIAESYTLLLTPEAGVGFVGSWLEFPYVMADGKSVERAASEALILAIAHMLETDRALPSPSSEQRRSEQVNIRLTALEKTLLEAMAKQGGYRSISDYIRAAAMAKAS